MATGRMSDSWGNRQPRGQFWVGDSFSWVELLRDIASARQGRVCFSASDHGLLEDHNSHDHKTPLLMLIFPVSVPMAMSL